MKLLEPGDLTEKPDQYTHLQDAWAGSCLLL